MLCAPSQYKIKVHVKLYSFRDVALIKIKLESIRRRAMSETRSFIDRDSSRDYIFQNLLFLS